MQPSDYVSLIEMLLARTGARTGRERAEAYTRAQAALNGTLDKIDPPLSTRERSGEVRKLSTAIRLVDAKQRDAERQAAERAEASIVAALGHLRLAAPGEFAEAASTESGADLVLHPLPPIGPTALRLRVDPVALGLERLRIIMALVMRQMHLAMSRDRSYYLWLFIEAFIQIGFIILGYWLLGHEYVLDMPAPAFAVVGASSWLMFRTTVRIMLTPESVMYIAQFPKVFYLDVLLSQALFIAMFYLVVVTVFMTGIDYFGYIYHLDDVLAVLGWWFGLWMMAFACGLACGALAQRAAWGRRLIQIALRIMVVFAGVAFVTEQLPEDYKPYFLWNPILHGIQSLRGAMFVEYRSEDANTLYFLFALALAMAFGFAADRAARLRKSRL